MNINLSVGSRFPHHSAATNGPGLPLWRGEGEIELFYAIYYGGKPAVRDSLEV